MRSNLVSKIATAYNTMGAQPRGPAAGEDEDIQNPELDRAFEAMIEANEERARSGAIVLPPGPSLYPGKTGDTQQDGKELEYACPECGDPHAEDDSFCAKCGRLLQESTALQVSNSQEPGTSLVVIGSKRRQPSHSCHCCNDRKQSYLLLAIALLLTFIAWQQWQQAHPPPGQIEVTGRGRATQAAQPVTPAAAGLPALTTVPAASHGADRFPQPKIERPQRRSVSRSGRGEAEPEVVWHIRPPGLPQE